MKKMYKQPIVEATQLMPASIVLAGSPGALQNSGSGTDVLSGDVVGNAPGRSSVPDSPHL